MASASGVSSSGAKDLATSRDPQPAVSRITSPHAAAHRISCVIPHPLSMSKRLSGTGAFVHGYDCPLAESHRESGGVTAMSHRAIAHIPDGLYPDARRPYGPPRERWATSRECKLTLGRSDKARKRCA